MKLFIVLITLIPSLAFADDLFRNSEMNSAVGWKGDKSYDEIEGNKVLRLKASPNKIMSFFQDANTRNLDDVVLRFRYRTADYKGRGLQLRGQRLSGAGTFKNLDLIADGKWHEQKWLFSEIRGNPKITFFFNLKEGEGTVYFDDISLVAKE